MLRERNLNEARCRYISRMTVTLATPDRKTVTALTRSLVEPARITACLRRVSSWYAGTRVVDAQCVALPLDPRAHTFSVCGELKLAAPTSWATLHQVMRAVAEELRAAGFAVE
jgi:hypothetical protein